MEDPTLQNGQVEFVPSSETYEWLDKLLKNAPLMDDMLAWAWLYGEAEDGSDWTRDRELSEWIAESQIDWSAWRGVERLLEVLLSNGRPIPVVLVTWALEVAARIRRPPVRKRGRDGTQNVLRDRNITMAVNVMRNLGYPATSNTGQSACRVVAKYANLSYEAVRTIWLSHKHMTVADYLDLVLQL